MANAQSKIDRAIKILEKEQASNSARIAEAQGEIKAAQAKIAANTEEIKRLTERTAEIINDLKDLKSIAL